MIRMAFVELGENRYNCHTDAKIDWYWYPSNISDADLFKEIEDLEEFYDLVFYPERV